MTEEIRAAIAADGPIPFERFMDLALYGTQGFYTGPAGGSAGRRGDLVLPEDVRRTLGEAPFAHVVLGRPNPVASELGAIARGLRAGRARRSSRRF